MSTPEMPQTPQQPAAPGYPAAAPAPAAAAPVAAEPGKGLSIAAIILAFLAPLVGLILGIFALVQSKKAGQKNGLALASIIVAAVVMVIEVIIIAVLIASAAALGTAAIESGLGGEAAAAAQACLDGAVTVEVAGQTVNCADVLQ